MPITEELVAEVVAETSERMKDPSYVQMAVGDFVQGQKNISQYLSSRAPRIGGAQALVTVVFHAQILSECLERGLGKAVPIVSFPQLDKAAQGEPAKLLAEREPVLANYIASNVDEEKLRVELCKVAHALVLASEGSARKKG
jgi:hypothetical protein